METISGLLAAYNLLKGWGLFPSEQGSLPEGMEYITGYRQSDGGIYKDGDIVFDSAAGLPVGRWSYTAQKFQSLEGFTIEGYPRFSLNNPPSASDPVWTSTYSKEKTGDPIDPELKALAAQWRETAGFYGPITEPQGIQQEQAKIKAFSLIIPVASIAIAILTKSPLPLLGLLASGIGSGQGTRSSSEGTRSRSGGHRGGGTVNPGGRT